MNLLVSCILMLISACTGTPAELRIQREIQAEYDKLAAAYAPRLDAKQMARYTRDWFELNQQPIEVGFTVESVELRSKDEAAVMVLQRASRYQDREGKRVRVEHEVRQRETWQRTPAGWKIRMVDHIDLANLKRWIDGELEAK